MNSQHPVFVTVRTCAMSCSLVNATLSTILLSQAAFNRRLPRKGGAWPVLVPVGIGNRCRPVPYSATFLENARLGPNRTWVHNRPLYVDSTDLMAEREGFEPPVPLRVRLISSQVHSTGLCHLSAFSLHAPYSGSGVLLTCAFRADYAGHCGLLTVHGSA